MMKKKMRLKEELKTRRSCRKIISTKIVSMSSKLCCDRKTRCRSWRSRKHYRCKNHRSVGTSSNEVSEPGAEKVRENVEFLSDAINLGVSKCDV